MSQTIINSGGVQLVQISEGVNVVQTPRIMSP